MTTLGKYELFEQVGRGGFGTVYRAINTSLGREEALKILHPQLMVDENFVERFIKEAHVLASLDHPNVVTIFELGEIDGRVFIAVRYLSGGNLQQYLQKQGSLPYKKALAILTQVCEGLQVAHDRGLVHCDIKPANIVFDGKGNAIISDFGLARAVQISGLSTSTSIAGTPEYRAPEMWRADSPVSPASDVYSLGCILVEMLTGKILFEGTTPDQIITHHLLDGPRLPLIWPTAVPAGLSGVIRKSLCKDSSKRQKDAATFLQELQNCSIIEPEPRSDPNPIKNDTPQEIKIVLAPGVDMDFIYIPVGEFLMGSDPKADEHAESDEQPQRAVYQDDFSICKFPVTNAQYRAFIQSTGYNPPEHWRYRNYPPEKADHPVVNITWNDALYFCKWASVISQRGISLPSEAQWEKAGRGTDGRIFPWGNQKPDTQLANFFPNIKNTTPVGTYPSGASPYGVMDLSGNVWEWVDDWYRADTYSAGPSRNPRGPIKGEEKIIRGGSWMNVDYLLRLAIRGRCHPFSSDFHIGFRCSLK